MGRNSNAIERVSKRVGWYSSSASIPEDEVFNSILHGFVFNCPAALKRGKGEQTTYMPVSSRKRCSFRSRNIAGSLLTTLGAQIKRLVDKDCYQIVGTKSSVYTSVDEAARYLTESSSRSDEFFNLIVFRRRSDMSDPEAVFYAVRNAFAHGSFEVTSPVGGGERVYLLEAAKDGVPKARIRLKESQMQELLHIGRFNKSSVKQLQQKRQRRR